MDKKEAKLSKEIASVISNIIPFEKQQVGLVARPLRLAFIINDKLLPENLFRVLTYISSIWGGYYSCLIPTDGNKISDVDWENLNVYEPDKIVLCANEADSFSSELIAKIRNEIYPFSIVTIDEWNPEKDILNVEMKRNNDPFVSSIPLIYPMVHRLEQFKQPIQENESNVLIPDIKLNHPLVLFVAAQGGVVSDYYKKIYLDGYKAKRIEFVNDTIEEHLSLLGEIESKYSPLDMTTLFLQYTETLSSTPIPEGLNIVFAGNNFVRDLCLFWNLHIALRFMRKFTLLFLPIDLFRGKKNLLELCTAIKLSPWINNRINLYSASVSGNRLSHLKNRFQELLGSTSTLRLIKESIPVAYFQIKNVEENTEVAIENNKFSLKCLKPEFSNLIRGGEWAVDIKFNRPYEYPSFSKLTHLLNGSPRDIDYGFYGGYWIRPAYKKFVHRANNNTSFLKGRLISNEQAYKEVFQEKGYSCTLTEKHSYTEGFLKLLQTPDILDDHKVIDFFWRLSKQDAYTYQDLCGELKKGDDSNKIIDDFISKRILIRGMEFRCGSCGLSRFYPINNLGEEMQCPGCLSRLQPPPTSTIKFRLNELALRATEQGSIPVVLTHKYFEKLNYNQTLRLFGAEISKDEEKIDVDYITTYEGGLVFIECKDFKHGALPKEKIGAIQQLRKLVILAKQVDASIVILSTLMPHPCPDFTDIANEIEAVKNKYNIHMHLISLSEKGIVDLKHPEKLVKQPFSLNDW